MLSTPGFPSPLSFWGFPCFCSHVPGVTLVLQNLALRWVLGIIPVFNYREQVLYPLNYLPCPNTNEFLEGAQKATIVKGENGLKKENTGYGWQFEGRGKDRNFALKEMGAGQMFAKMLCRRCLNIAFSEHLENKKLNQKWVMSPEGPAKLLSTRLLMELAEI